MPKNADENIDVIAGLDPAIHRFEITCPKRRMAGSQASESDAVLRTAMPGHDNLKNVRTNWDELSRSSAALRPRPE
jgi:hypothetical protein